MLFRSRRGGRLDVYGSVAGSLAAASSAFAFLANRQIANPNPPSTAPTTTSSTTTPAKTPLASGACSSLKQMAQAKEVTLPAAAKPKHQTAMKKLQDLSGDEFDRAYMTQMVKDHGETLTLVQKTAKQAKDDELKAAAKKAEPAIRQHLDTAQKLAGLAGAKSQ